MARREGFSCRNFVLFFVIPAYFVVAGVSLPFYVAYRYWNGVVCIDLEKLKAPPQPFVERSSLRGEL